MLRFLARSSLVVYQSRDEPSDLIGCSRFRFLEKNLGESSAVPFISVRRD